MVKKTKQIAAEVIDAMPDGLILVGMDGKITAVNPAMEKITGYEKNEWLGKDAVDLAQKLVKSKEDLGKAMESLRAALEGKVPSPRVYTIVTKDGREVPTLSTLSFMKDVEGKPTSMVVVFKEITERKRMEEALRDSEKRYRTLVETMNEGLDIIDENGVTIYTNDKLCEILGYSRDELIGHPVTDFLDKNGRKIFEEQWARLRKGERRSYEIERTRRDGQEIFLTVSSSPIFDADGHFNGTFAVVTDITERKRADEALRESEKRYRTLVETMNEGLHVLDENGVTIFVNDKLCEMLGYSRDEMIGRPLTDFLDKSAQNIFEEQWAMRRKGERGSYELVRTRKDGQKIFTLVSAAPIFDADGNFKGSFAVITDLAAILQITVSLMERMAT